MKKLFTLCMGLIAALAIQAQSDFPVQFADKNGNIIADGTTLNITEYEESDFGDIMMRSGIFAQNTTDKDLKVKSKYTISTMNSGTFQTCFPGNCVTRTQVGSYENPEGTLLANVNKDMQTEWLPTKEGSCVVVYQINYFEKDIFGIEKEKDGPKITLNFTYSTTGVVSAKTDKAVSSQTCYDLQGRLLSQPGKGLCVVKTVYTDGTTATVKRVMK